jgi:hypothetical protein
MLKKFTLPILPVEIMDMIVLWTGDGNVAHSLRDRISQYVLDRIEKNILIYGEVQGGKTRAIIEYIRENASRKKVLVVQNSLLVLRQYEQRLRSECIRYQVITANTEGITEDLVIILNNKYRYNYFSKFEMNNYILMLDESDQTINACPLKLSKFVKKTVHITATPYNRMTYDRCIIVPRVANYYSVEDLTVSLTYTDDNTETVENFLKSNTGIMLINRYSYIGQMQHCAVTLARTFPQIPVVLLTSDKKIYLNNSVKILRYKSISKIIDNLRDYKHIIFVANRLSNRGLSYVSSDYTRHLTCQITRIRSNVTSFFQSLRILGVYNSKSLFNLELVIPDDEEKLFEKHLRFFKSFDIKEKINNNVKITM